MKRLSIFNVGKIISFTAILSAFLCLLPIMGSFAGGRAEAAIKKGDLPPRFSELKAVQKKPMVVLYFFQINSKPSVAGLDHLKEMYDDYKKAGIAILVISKDSRKLLNQFFETNPVPFYVISDDGTIFDQYEVKVVLPVTYILGAGGRVSDRFEGGGASSYKMMTAVAQHSLDLKKPQLSKAIYASVLKSDPANIAAKTGLANAYFSEGKFDQAKQEYTRIAQLTSEDAILGKEGLVKTYIKEGEPDKALSLAARIQDTNPASKLVHLINGNILAGKGNQEEALAQYAKVTNEKTSPDWQTAEAYNRSGRIYSEQGKYDLAEKMYQNAVVYNPFSSEMLTNQGVLLEKQGQPQKAKALYEEATTADPEDKIANSLSKRMEAHLDFQEDMEKQKRIDTLVSDLAAQYQKNSVKKTTPTDTWSSVPLSVAFFGIKTTGEVREGVTEAIQQELTQNLMAKEGTGRIQVVEREILDKLLAELKLGSSDLADPETALRLGKLVSARLMITGSLFSEDDTLKLSLRLIDPETSAIKVIYSSGKEKSLSDLTSKTSSALNQRITKVYPIQGRIVSVEKDNQVIVNLDARHGVYSGLHLKIIKEGEQMVFNGKVVGAKKEDIGTIEITSVDEGFSYGLVVTGKGLAEKGQKVVEESRP
jgi:tetratricopeptide (TPR) repeat protein